MCWGITRAARRPPGSLLHPTSLRLPARLWRGSRSAGLTLTCPARGSWASQGAQQPLWHLRLPSAHLVDRTVASCPSP